MTTEERLQKEIDTYKKLLPKFVLYHNTLTEVLDWSGGFCYLKGIGWTCSSKIRVLCLK